MYKLISTESLTAAIDRLAQAETMTRTIAGPLSTDLLCAIMFKRVQNDPETTEASLTALPMGAGGMALINGFLAACQGPLKASASLFFKHFLPMEYSKDTGKFIGWHENRVKKAARLCLAFLSDPTNDLYSWSEENVISRDKADYEFGKLVARDIKKGSKNGLSIDAILTALAAVVESTIAEIGGPKVDKPAMDQVSPKAKKRARPIKAETATATA